MNEQTLHDELKVIIAEIIEVDEFDDDANFVGELGVDSMLALEIVARIERRYRIRIPEERFAEMQTLTISQGIVSEAMQQQTVNS